MSLFTLRKFEMLAASSPPALAVPDELAEKLPFAGGKVPGSISTTRSALQYRHGYEGWLPIVHNPPRKEV
jgi:hypothetical protein